MAEVRDADIGILIDTSKENKIRVRAIKSLADANNKLAEANLQLAKSLSAASNVSIIGASIQTTGVGITVKS